MEQLAIYWQQAKDAAALVLSFLARAKDAPRQIWEGSAGQAGTRFFIILVLVAVAFGLIALVVSFLRAGWREKLHILLVTVLALMIVGAILWYGLRSAEDAALPEAETVVLGDATALSYPQYTLDHDEGNAYWKLADDVFTVSAGDGEALQLTGLSDVEGNSFLVGSFRREPDGNLYILLQDSDFSVSATGDVRRWGTDTYAELHVLPGAALTDAPWYADPGQSRTDGDVEYTVVEADGRDVIFLMEDGWQGQNGEPLRALCLARQDGPDLIWTALRTISTQLDYRGDSNERDNDASPTYLDFDPAADPALRAALSRTAAALLDDHTALLRELSPEDLSSLLPDAVTVPGDGKDRGFSIPCAELLEMGGDETSQFLRFRGPDPHGDPVLYTMRNGGVTLMNGRPDEYEAWRDAYEAGEAEPDALMSFHLEGTAVAYDGGWVMNPGDFIRNLVSQENYYYLTAD